MIIRQFLHEAPVDASYLIGRGWRGVVAVVCPALIAIVTIVADPA
jgi:hypothetical protein